MLGVDGRGRRTRISTVPLWFGGDYWDVSADRDVTVVVASQTLEVGFYKIDAAIVDRDARVRRSWTVTSAGRGASSAVADGVAAIAFWRKQDDGHDDGVMQGFDVKDGRLLWERNLESLQLSAVEAGGQTVELAAYGGKFFVVGPQSPTVSIRAFDAHSGDELGRRGLHGIAWSSVLDTRPHLRSLDSGVAVVGASSGAGTDWTVYNFQRGELSRAERWGFQGRLQEPVQVVRADLVLANGTVAQRGCSVRVYSVPSWDGCAAEPPGARYWSTVLLGRKQVTSLACYGKSAVLVSTVSGDFASCACPQKVTSETRDSL